jgi:hypothetical protein
MSIYSNVVQGYFTTGSSKLTLFPGTHWVCDNCKSRYPAYLDEAGRLKNKHERPNGCVQCVGKKRKAAKEDVPVKWEPKLKPGEFAAEIVTKNSVILRAIVNSPQSWYNISYRFMKKSYGLFGASLGIDVPTQRRTSRIFDSKGIHYSASEMMARYPLPTPPKEIEVQRSSIELKKLIATPGVEIKDNEAIVVNSPNRRAYEEILKDSKNPNVKTLFHGTSAINLRDILKHGFLLPKERCGLAFGPGIYFGDTDKAGGFAKSARPEELFKKPPESAPRKAHKTYAEKVKLTAESEHYIIECDVALGNVYYPYRPIDCSELIKECRRDSVYYDGFSKPEWVVFDPNRILIKRIIKAPEGSTYNIFFSNANSIVYPPVYTTKTLIGI